VARRAGHGVRRIGAELRQLQPVVAHEKGQRLHVAHGCAHLDVQAQATLRAQQGGDAGHEGHPAASAKADLEGLAVLQQLRVDAQAGVHQEQPVIDGRHLHGARGRIQQQAGGFDRIGGDAVRPGKVVEGPVGDDAHRAARCMGGLGHRVQAAIPADRDHRRAARRRLRCGLGGHPLQVFRAADPQFTLAPTRREGGFDHRGFGVDIVGTR
jgi:hypothetical protein